MAEKRRKKYARRDFLKGVAAGGALGASLGKPSFAGEAAAEGGKQSATAPSSAAPGARVEYPRNFTGRNLKEIAFPLGGIGTGTVSLGGRGQLRDWEIFNRPDKGNELSYAFPAVWAKVGNGKPTARVLESRLLPPYERNESGLGSENVPGLPRFAEATFTGAYPFARIAFTDPRFPLDVRLEAFNPLVPLDVDASGWPMAILRYTIRNPNQVPAKVGVAWSVENPVGKEGRQAAFRQIPGLSGLYMDNPFLAVDDALKGTFALCAVGAPEGSVSYLRGWKRAEWWNGVLTFWDDFTDDGALDSASPAALPVGSVAVTQTVPARGTATFTFLLAWHFPNRTPERCGWAAPEGVPKSTKSAMPTRNDSPTRGTSAGKRPISFRSLKRALAPSPKPSNPRLFPRPCWMRPPAHFQPCAPTPASAPRMVNSTVSKVATTIPDAATAVARMFGITSTPRRSFSLRWRTRCASRNFCAIRRPMA